MGCRILTDNRARFKAAYKKRAGQLAQTAAEQTAEMARQNAPVESGALADSIVGHSAPNGKQQVTVGVDYAPEVELGTIEAPSQPFLGPAFAIGAAQMKNAARRVAPE